MAEKQNKEKAGIRVKDPQKYEYAYLLYMQKVPQKEIAERGIRFPYTKTFNDLPQR